MKRSGRGVMARFARRVTGRIGDDGWLLSPDPNVVANRVPPIDADGSRADITLGDRPSNRPDAAPVTLRHSLLPRKAKRIQSRHRAGMDPALARSPGEGSRASDGRGFSERRPHTHSWAMLR